MAYFNAPLLNQPQAVLDLHNTRSGRTFLVGAGSSLLAQMEVLPYLQDEATWGVNYLPQWEDMPFDLTYYAISEQRHVIRHGIGDFGWSGMDVPKFAFHWGPVRSDGFQWVAKAPAEISIFDAGTCGLGEDLPPISSAFCTIFYCLQLGLWMGYREFYLLGNEFSLTGYPWDPTAQRRFDESLGRRIEGSARLLRMDMEKQGASLIDCTPNGRLGSKGILEYKPLEEVVA